MFGSDQYALLDFGEGRKLERFGSVVLDRPSPPAEQAERRRPEIWKKATARYVRSGGEAGEWLPADAAPEKWAIAHRSMAAGADSVLELRPTPFGHVGVFAEQAGNWDWLASRVQEQDVPTLRVLNLFAYTGGATLAAAGAGAQVTHIDAARNVVSWARRNAELSGLSEHPIRWIAEDAVKFVNREIRRGNQYDGIILDPPTYGHGPQGEVWQIQQDLDPLLEACRRLLVESPAFVLLTSHSPELAPQTLRDKIGFHFADLVRHSPPEAKSLTVFASTGRRLSAGAVVRWSAVN